MVKHDKFCWNQDKADVELGYYLVYNKMQKFPLSGVHKRVVFKMQ